MEGLIGRGWWGWEEGKLMVLRQQKRIMTASGKTG